MSIPDQIFCDCCGHTIIPSENTNFWKILPCSHELCSRCFTVFTSNAAISCPVTRCMVTPNAIIRNWFESKRNCAELFPNKEEIRLMAGMGPVLSYRSNSESIHVNLERDPDALPSIFAKLKQFINPKVKINYKENKDISNIPGSNAFEKLESLAKEDELTILHRCVTALSTGVTNSTLQMGDLIKMFVSCENIRRIQEARNSVLRRLVSRATNIFGDSYLFLLLQKLGVSYSRQTEYKTEGERARKIELQLKSLELNKYCYAILLFDNLGFKNRQGYRKGLGYEQFTVLKVIIINAIELGKLGVHEYKWCDALDRACEEWDDLREEADHPSFESLLKASHEDTNVFVRNTSHILSMIIKSEAEGLFPSDSVIKRTLAYDTLRIAEPKIVLLPCYAGRDKTDDSNDETPEDMEEEQTANATEGIAKFNYGVIYDIPMRRDLNKKDTVIQLLQYTESIQEAILNGSDDIQFTGQVPCLQDLKIGFGGDGHPISAAQRYMKENRDDENPFFERIMAVFGGFHLMLEMYKKIGSLFQHTHLRFINGLFRLSLGAVNFVITPSDPNQAEGEMIQRHLAFNLSALRCVLWLKRRKLYEEIDWDGDDDELLEYDMESWDSEQDDDPILEDEVSVTVAELIRFILYRAKHNVQTFILLMEMRFSEVLFLLQRAEYQGDAGLYCVSMKYALMLTVNANAFHYVEMICNFFVDRKCMSESERAVLDKFILFRKTKFKKFIFSDRSVEWVMRDIRQYLGKYFKGSTTEQLKRVLLQMHETKELKNGIVRSSLTVGRKSRVKMDKGFMEPYCFCMSGNIWMGVPMRVKAKPFQKRLNPDGEEDRVPLYNDEFDDNSDNDESDERETTTKMFYSPDGTELYSDILSLYSRGEERAKEYFDRHFIDGEMTDTKRSGTVLRQVNVTSGALHEELEMGVCVDEDKINKDRKIYTRARVEAELNLLIEELDDKQLDVPDITKAKKKSDFVAALVTARKTLKAKNPLTWEDATKENIKRRFEAHCKDPSDVVKSEIKFPFYSYNAECMESVLAREGSTFKFDEDDRFVYNSSYRVNPDEWYAEMNELNAATEMAGFPN